MSEHPTLYIWMHWRSGRRTFNIALALRGRSSGWGMPSNHWWSGKGRPRRWFVGHLRVPSVHRGLEIGYTRQNTRRTLVDLTRWVPPRPDRRNATTEDRA